MGNRGISVLVGVLAAFVVFASPAWAVRYVALGDSYSSGVGTRSYYDTTCYRSVYAYPHLVRNAHPDWTFVNATCSGARTGDVINTQAASLTSGTNWITYTIGGNDAGFSSVITECAQPSWASNCDAAINSAQSYINNTLPGRLDQVNNTIKSRSPNARVVALNYPRIFNGTDCNGGTWFSSSEMTRLNQTADLLSSKISAAATRAGANFTFRSVISRFIGHAVCDGGAGSATEWINGLSNPIRESYHPKTTGQANGYAPVVRGVTG